MPNGGEAQARADRYRARYAQNAKARRNGLEQYGRAQPGMQPYRAEMESEDSTVTGPGGISAKLPIPRAGRLAIGFGLCVLFICVGAAIVLSAWR